jgi:hypothetical protein
MEQKEIAEAITELDAWIKKYDVTVLGFVPSSQRGEFFFPPYYYSFRINGCDLVVKDRSPTIAEGRLIIRGLAPNE